MSDRWGNQGFKMLTHWPGCTLVTEPGHQGSCVATWLHSMCPLAHSVAAMSKSPRNLSSSCLHRQKMCPWLRKEGQIWCPCYRLLESATWGRCGCVSWMLDAAAESCVASQVAGLAVAAIGWGGQGASTGVPRWLSLQGECCSHRTWLWAVEGPGSPFRTF